MARQTRTRAALWRQTRLYRAARTLLRLLPVWVAALLGAFFIRQATDPAAYPFRDYRWNARWIAAPFPGPTGCFRKTFSVSAPVESAYLAIAADNFYTIQVNGRNLKPFFAPDRYRTWVRNQSTFSGLGYPRNYGWARIYDIRRALRPGRNVIAVHVQSDENPRLALEAVVRTGLRAEVVTDGTWKVAPFSQRQNNTPWTLPAFSDRNWADAVDTGEPVDIPVDGDVAAFETPIAGTFIGSRVYPLAPEVRFRRRFLAPADADRGWLRLSTTADYDLFLNGRLIGTTSAISRYPEQVLVRNEDIDTFHRVRSMDLSREYPLPWVPRRTDVYALRGTFTHEVNTLEVALHPRMGATASEAPTFHIEGAVANRDGDTEAIRSDELWQSRDAVRERPWGPVQVTSIAGRSFAVPAYRRFRGTVDPDDRGSWPAAAKAGILAIMLLGGGALAKRVGSRMGPRGSRRGSECWGGFATAPAVVLATAWFITAVVAPAGTDISFAQHRYALGVLTAAATVWLAVLAAARVPRFGAALGLLRRRLWRGSSGPAAGWRGFARRWGVAIAVALIVAAAFVVYTRDLGYDGLVADEYVSVYAASGILKHGVPVYPYTGVVYTRSSVFHYVLALFIAAFGPTSPWGTRFMAGCYQLATIVLSYLFGKEIKGRKAGLLATVLVAFSPYMIFYAREVRFYTQFGFFTTFTFYWLLKSLRNPERPGARAWTILGFCGAYLSQQFAVTMLPGILLAILFSGQLREWFRLRTLPWLGLMLFVVAADFVAYKKRCATPLPYVDAETIILLSLHTDILEVLPGMLFLGFERAQAVIGLFYFGGLAASVARMFRRHDRDRAARGWVWWNYLYLTSAPTIFLTALLAPRPASRYIAHAGPIAAVVAACAAIDFGQALFGWVHKHTGSTAAARVTKWAYAAAFLALTLVCFRPMRTWAALGRKNNIDNTEASRFIARNRLPGDKVIYRSPEIGLVELGAVDYTWRPKRGSIFMYTARDGRIRERDSAAIMLDNPDKLRRAMFENKRLWLMLPLPVLSSPDTPLTDEMVRFVNSNFRVVAEPFGTQVLLWDRKWAHLKDTSPRRGYDALNY